jgi:ribosomal protein S18 acetylase RimI-like enzyme
MTVVIRDARADDAPAIAPLLETLGYASDPDLIRQRWATLLKTDPTARVLVGEVDGQVLGVAALHVTPVLHRPTPVGRVTALAVLPASQGTGVGRALIEAAERHFAATGLERIEITSGLSHRPAYDFYRHLGYEDHGLRFAKAISPA